MNQPLGMESFGIRMRQLIARPTGCSPSLSGTEQVVVPARVEGGEAAPGKPPSCVGRWH